MTNVESPNPTPVNDTQPSVNYPRYDAREGGLRPPPKLLFYGCIGLFILGIAGTLAGVYVFREVMPPSQQQLVIGRLPFMAELLPAQPAPDDTVPTPSAPVDEDAAQSLLSAPIGEDESAIAPEPTEDPTPQPTLTATPEEDAADGQAVAQAATNTPPPTATMIPSTPTPTVTLPPPTATSTPRPTENIPATFAAAEAEMDPISPQNWPASALNTGFTWDEQTWNNCGPTTVTIAMSYYGWSQDQAWAENRIKPNREDKNVSPHELVRFVNEQGDGINAMYRHGGDLDMLRRLVGAGYPVIIERSHMFEGYEWIGHYQAIVGYDDGAQEFIVMDSFLGDGEDGLGITETYAEVEAGWQEFNRIFIVVYPPSQEANVFSLIGNERRTLEASAEHAYTIAQEEARADQTDAHAWFNMGTSLNILGRHEEAQVAYDKATSLDQIRWRMYWYQFGIFETYYEVGRYDDVINLVENNLSNNGRYVEETYYWQGKVREARGDLAGARESYRRALSMNRYYDDAEQALNAISS
jgi:hypothetical protein